jgi:2-octaprenyl-6-methoxyphenol hydroxylase
METNPKIDYDLAIVGGGIVGLTLAAALKNSGLNIAIIEKSAQSIAVTKGRAYAISLMSGKIFEKIGIWSDILPQITQFKQVNISDADYQGIVELQPQDLGQKGQELGLNKLGYAAEHHVLLSALENYIKDADNITKICPAEVLTANYQADMVTITTKIHDQEQSINTRLLVGSDGAKSPIRQAANINTKGWKYWQSCVIATIKPEKSHENIAYERFWYSGPMGILPLTNNRFQVVWTSPHQEAEKLKDLEQKEFLDLLKYRTGGIFGELEMISDRYIFPVQLMQSDRYVQHRLALIGDAAHCCHPVAGQGMNLGIRDAATLAQVLKIAHQQKEDLGTIQVLNRYEQWRKKENLVILGFTDFLDRLFSNQIAPIVLIRRMALLIMQNLPLIKTYTLQLMTGLRGKYSQLISP